MFRLERSVVEVMNDLSHPTTDAEDHDLRAAHHSRLAKVKAAHLEAVVGMGVVGVVVGIIGLGNGRLEEAGVGTDQVGTGGSSNGWACRAPTPGTCRFIHGLSSLFVSLFPFESCCEQQYLVLHFI